MKNLNLIRRFTIGSMILGLAVPMTYHLSLSVSRYNHFNGLTKQVCKTIEPLVQTGGRNVLEYLVSTLSSQGLNASPEIEFKDHENLISAPILNKSAKIRETCEFQGITGIDVSIYYDRVPMLNILYLYIYLISVPFLFFVFIYARRGVIRLQRKVADIIEAQMKSLLGMELDSKPQTNGLFYKLFDLELPLLRYLKRHIESLETDLKNYSQKIVEQQKREVLMDVAAQMAHEIVTPISNLQIILQSDMAKENQELLLLELTQIKSLSEKLLSEYRGEPWEQRQKTETIDLIENLKVIVEGTKIFAKKTGPVTFEFNHNDEDNFELTGDRPQFVAAISNILRNSVEALDKNGGHIKISIDKTLEFLTLTIADNGCGIEEKNLSKVFQNKVSIGKKNGTGIGLYQVKSTIESMNGKVELESELGVGTVIRLIWPADSVKKTGRPSTGAAPASDLAGNPDLVLIDDKEINHLAWKIQAKRSHINMIAFKSYDEFLLKYDQLEKDTPIFVDYIFENERLSGKDVVEKLILSGFKNVHIATGLPPDQVNHPAGVKSVVGKQFPQLDLL